MSNQQISDQQLSDLQISDQQDAEAQYIMGLFEESKPDFQIDLSVSIKYYKSSFINGKVEALNRCFNVYLKLFSQCIKKQSILKHSLVENERNNEEIERINEEMERNIEKNQILLIDIIPYISWNNLERFIRSFIFVFDKYDLKYLLIIYIIHWIQKFLLLKNYMLII